MKNYGDLSVKAVTGKGKSIFANKNYKKGEFIFLLAGPIGTKWTRYTIPIDEKLSIDPVPLDNLGRYLNHSCEPNAGIKKRTMIVAFQDIKKDDEIRIDYSMIVDTYGVEITQKQLVCTCGSKYCRGKLGAYDVLPQKLKKKYKGFISEWLSS